LTVAYLANKFPAAVEPYVGEQIKELRERGVSVIPGSVRRPDINQRGAAALFDSETLCLQPVRVLSLLRALVLMVRRWDRISSLVTRLFLSGKESPKRRMKALLHTWLGAYYAVLLEGREVDHIHVHHGYFGSWIAMVAARLLGVSYSLTLYGSDLLVNGAYLDTKLKDCQFCINISEYNRRYVLEHFPAVDSRKIVLSRLGVAILERAESSRKFCLEPRKFTLLTVGRLHAVKDHAFLIRACARLRDRGLEFECAIAGAGPERRRLESLIRQHRMQDRVTLLGYVPEEQMDSLYRRADVVVLTSRSEGIPLVLMEAMARGKVVLAPAITGIPEIVIPGRTGFLYAPGELDDFVTKIFFLEELIRAEGCLAASRLDWLRCAARLHIAHNFNHGINLAQFCDQFLNLIAPRSAATQEFANPNLANPDFAQLDLAQKDWSAAHENSLLQQI